MTLILMYIGKMPSFTRSKTRPFFVYSNISILFPILSKFPSILNISLRQRDLFRQIQNENGRKANNISYVNISELEILSYTVFLKHFFTFKSIIWESKVVAWSGPKPRISRIPCEYSANKAARPHD